MCFGRGPSDYLEDSAGNPIAIAQAIQTRMLLFRGEWWENIKDGLPLWQQILGQRIKNKGIIDRILVDRIKGLRMPNTRLAITSVLNVSSTHNSETREYKFNSVVNTVYGKLVVTNASQGM
jgi:hypothetical protein